MKSISKFLLFFGCITYLSNCFNNNLTIEQEVRKTALEASDTIIWSNPNQSTIEDHSTTEKYHYLIADTFTVKLDIPQEFIKSIKAHREIAALISSLIEIQCLNIIDVL